MADKAQRAIDLICEQEKIKPALTHRQMQVKLQAAGMKYSENYVGILRSKIKKNLLKPTFPVGGIKILPAAKPKDTVPNVAVVKPNVPKSADKKPSEEHWMLKDIKAIKDAAEKVGGLARLCDLATKMNEIGL